MDINGNTRKLLERASLGRLSLKNRVFRSATFEGMADAQGQPGRQYLEMYRELARTGVGGIITGFAFTEQQGRAMQPGQAGIDCDDKIPIFGEVTDAVHQEEGVIFLQLAHAGRQTSAKAAGGRLVGASSKRSLYFGGMPAALTEQEAASAAEKFGDAARRAREAGFDGVQIHAAHGYLIHQFLLPAVNNRQDRFGIDPHTGIGTAFLGAVLDSVRKKCGMDFPVLIKVSGGDDYLKKFTPEMFSRLVEFIEKQSVAAVEVSYGTMDYALNIFRGTSLPVETILKHNPKYRTRNPFLRAVLKNVVFPAVSARFKKLTPGYNLPYALAVKALSRIPVITVGGFRSGREMADAVECGLTDFVSLCRPFLREPDFMERLERNPDYVSLCSGCNRCAIMCDSKFSTRCYSINSGGPDISAVLPEKEFIHAV